jgi:hypothetical protein
VIDSQIIKSQSQKTNTPIKNQFDCKTKEVNE